ncbi:DUF3106 domain-containing protein [Piscinibacter aquaticus]|uniref:DUF3106 domain-containing protein n=1 Tax=Piscinibacter aquaticus TaxID=392597 RepID=A0A5C6TYY6_9BURK|nr:DUF3106 domain-containing protein [Piscinibacter aquaticus]
MTCRPRRTTTPASSNSSRPRVTEGGSMFPPRRLTAVAPWALVLALASAGAITWLPAVAQAPATGRPGPTAETGTRWQDLSPSQRSALKPLERDWSGIDAARKQKWVEIANRYPSMPAAEQQRISERMTEWAKLSPAERGRAAEFPERPPVGAAGAAGTLAGISGTLARAAQEAGGAGSTRGHESPQRRCSAAQQRPRRAMACRPSQTSCPIPTSPPRLARLPPRWCRPHPVRRPP